MGPSGAPPEEWPAAASIVAATGEHRERVWGHGAVTFQIPTHSVLQTALHFHPVLRVSP